MRKSANVKNLYEILNPNYFEKIIGCTKLIAKYDELTETYGAPSLAANMGTLLKDAIDVAILITLKKYKSKSEQLENLRTLKDLITNEWKYEISTIANNNLEQRKWNKPSLIPLAQDLNLIRTFLNVQSKKHQDKLKSDNNDESSYKQLQEVTFVQLILLNRRRVGELQRITLKTYKENIEKKISTEFDQCLTETERILLKSFHRITVRGKRGRGVPVLFTEKMVSATNLLLKLRSNFISETNIYLFGQTNSNNCITGFKAISKYVRLAGVENPKAITSTKLRKHLATMSQVVNLTDQDLDQLASFMGHTTNIHKEYYRLPNDVFQTAKISKLLLLSEKGKLSKFKGKRLEDIDIDLCVSEAESDDQLDFDDFPHAGADSQHQPSTSSATTHSTGCNDEMPASIPISVCIISNKNNNNSIDW